MLMQSSVNVVDDVYFRHLPDQLVASNAQSALQPSLILVWLFGGSARRDQRRHASDHRAPLHRRRRSRTAGAVLSNAVWFTLVGGIVTTIFAFFLIPTILARLIPSPEVRAIAESYSHWRLFAFVSMSMTQAVKGFFDGIGKTTYHFVASLIMNVANIILCWAIVHASVTSARPRWARRARGSPRSCRRGSV